VTRADAAPAAISAGAVAFTDISGFTEFTAVRGDDDALRLLVAQERIVSGHLPPGARLVKELGDGLLLWFPDACAAIATTLALQDSFRAEEALTELPLWIRIGMHWGRPRRRGNDIIGHDVNVAARVTDVAGPAEVVVTEAFLAELNGHLQNLDVQVDELGPVVMKGLPEAIRLFRVSRC
jgi:adenylate cyclase